MNLTSVAVVIPTTGRSSVINAVESVLSQTVSAHEIIVVYDGDPSSSGFAELRVSLPNIVTLKCTGQSTNGNYARNLGVLSATSELVAFLDDDDVWLSDKLEKQIAAIPVGSNPWLQTTTVKVVDFSSGAEYGEWPGRGPMDGEVLGDYFFERRGIRQVPRFLQTSSWLAPRHLFLDQPFDPERTIHQDWDWIVRAQARKGLRLIHIEQPLVLYARNTAGSTSTSLRFYESRDWALDPNLPLSDRARGDFIVHMLLTRALREGRFREALALPVLARRVADPSVWGLLGAILRIGQFGVRRVARRS